MDADERRAIGKSTGITLGLAIVVVGAGITAAWWFGRWTGADLAWKQGTDRRLLGIEQTLEQVKKDGTAHRWNSLDMIRWADRLREANTDLQVPKPIVR